VQLKLNAQLKLHAALLFATTALISAASGQSPSSTHKHTATPAAQTAPAPTPVPCPPLTQMHVQPYTLKQEITRTQTLPDGSSVTSVTVTTSARDAEGRSYIDSTHTINGDTIHNISVYDPPTQTRYTWNVGPNLPQVVTVYRWHPGPQQTSVAPPARRYYPSSSQSLPPQTLNGIYVEGIRSTRTIPAGYEGNDHDLITTTEQWNSPDLGHIIRMINDDPHYGKSDTETTDIQRTADPALFQPPAGFQLKEHNR
jgi:hypothetical protein